MNLTTLVENTCGRSNLKPQHGLSLLIRAGNGNILFDTGQDQTFSENAAEMEIDIREIGAAVISHGHYDHGGGLETFLAMNTESPVYIRQGADGDFAVRLFFRYRYIGLDQSLFHRFPDRFIRVDGDREIAPGIHLLTSIPREYPPPGGNRKLMVKHQGRYEPDPFSHELLMVVDEPDGIVVVTGCGHSGILNLLSAARRRFPGKPVKAVVGGFHLIANPFLGTMGVSPAAVRTLAEEFHSLGCRAVVTGHCTGTRAARILKEELGGTLKLLSTGCTIDL